MAIPPKQIGYSEKANLLWEISRELDRMNSIMCTGDCPSTTTTTTTTVCNCREIISNLIVYNYYNCSGENIVCSVEPCDSQVASCIDISLPYTGVTPSETITEKCNCIP